MFVLAAGVFGLVLASFLVRHPLSSVSIDRTLPRRARVGDEVRLGYTITNQGRRPAPLFRIDDHFDAIEPASITVERLRPGESAHVELVRTALKRGVFEQGRVALTSGAPFGFARTSRSAGVPTTMTVVPDWVDLPSFPILEPSSFPSDVLHERARTGAGQEYMGVREYRPGDPQRAVHWRSTARVGQLVVREFEEEVQSRVTLLIAGADTGDPPDSAFEMLVGAAASIAIYALNTGHPVDLLRPAEDDVSHLGDPDRYDVLDWLAGATPLDVPLVPLVRKGLGRVGRRGTVVLLVPTVGATAAGIADAVRAIQSAGSRAIVVAARSSSWVEEGAASPVEEARLMRAGGGRAAVRMLGRGEDLARCLA